MEKIVEEVVDRKRSTDLTNTSMSYAQSTSSKTTPAKPVNSGTRSSPKLPPPVIELDEIYLNGINAGQLPSGEPGCARGCKDPSCRGVRHCLLKLPNLATGTCSRCARAHGGGTPCPATNKVCARCNKEGHFAAACRSAPTFRQQSKSGRQARRNERRSSQPSADDDHQSIKDVNSGDKGQQRTVCNAAITIDDVPEGEEAIPDIFAIRITHPTVVTQYDSPTVVQTNVPTLKGPQLPGADICVLALWDTGATGSFVRTDVINTLAARANTPVSWPEGKSQRIATLADNKSRVPLRGTCSLRLTTPKASAVITAYVVDHLSLPLVIGVPALQALGVRLEFSPRGKVSVKTGA
ncbi:hypothetical protein Pmar_PMAR018444, partial [Perkinsus marinus ATCC 50983]